MHKQEQKIIVFNDVSLAHILHLVAGTLIHEEVKRLQTDYLIIGSGAMGMAFADTLLSDTDATMIIVDRYALPGGHWNKAYPYVTLHQPSHFYGVPSTELSSGKKDEIGWNKGLYELASGSEVMAYFDKIMKHRFLPSGRVQYYPKCMYQGNNQFQSILGGESYEVEVNKKLIDATHLNTRVPSTHTPNFFIDEGVQFMPLNDLVNVIEPPDGYVVIGGGKTGIDACLWLLQTGVPPSKITWIVSRDAWLLNRLKTQPSLEFFEHSIGAQADQVEAIANAKSPDDLFLKLEEKGIFMRVDENIQPTMFHGATISEMEMEQLNKITNVIRKGRVQRITENEIILANGSISTSPNHIHVDCSATPLEKIEPVPVFQGDKIVPQTIRSYQPVFSASVIAHMEALYPNDEKKKNEMCQVVPIPDKAHDWIKMTAINMMNQFNWNQDKELRKWMYGNRLDGFSKIVKEADKTDPKVLEILNKFRSNAMAAAMNLQKLMVEVGDKV